MSHVYMLYFALWQHLGDNDHKQVALSTAAFTDKSAALYQAGLTQAEAEKQGLDVHITILEFEPQTEARHLPTFDPSAEGIQKLGNEKLIFEYATAYDEWELT